MSTGKDFPVFCNIAVPSSSGLSSITRVTLVVLLDHSNLCETHCVLASMFLHAGTGK
jgi:hypothetical protein